VLLSISRVYTKDIVNLLLTSNNLSLRGVDVATISNYLRLVYV
jgi:hypothetical protein